jgi:hypothetical protein
MRKNFRVHGLRIVAFGLAAAAIVSEITMQLWNRLLPAIFGLPSISFWQALGLLILGRLFFGSFGCRGRRPRFARGWNSMTPEERERFREAMSPEQRERFREGAGHGCRGAAAEPRM